MLVFLAALGVAYFLTPQVRALALRYGVIDRPDARRPHKRPTARGGGLAVVIAVHVACLAAVLFPWHRESIALEFGWWQKFALASLVLLVVGVIDDVRGLKPYVKLAGQVCAATLMTLSGTTFGKVFGYTLPPALDHAMVVVWIVAVINAFNLIDGLDGLASGLAIISGIGLCGIFIMGQVPGDMLVLLALIGACLGFLRYNFNPASIFLGDTGSMFIGFTLGVVSLQTLTKSTFLLSMTIPFLVLGVPIFDALLAIWRRSVRHWLRGTLGQSSKYGGIMQPDLEHLHHRLLKSGLSTRRVATVLCALNTALVLFGLLLTVFQSHAYGIFLLALLAAVYVLMRHLAIIELRDTGRAILGGLRRPTHITLVALGFPLWDMICMATPVALVMALAEPARDRFWNAWFLDLPVWVSPTFSLLAMSRVYITLWSRARFRDVLMLFGLLQGGILLSLGIALLIDPVNADQSILRAIVIAAFSQPLMIGVRVLYRAVEEILVYLRIKSEPELPGNRILLYGAGGRCQLFLKERSFNDSRSFDGRFIVGLVDDDQALHGQWVYGYQVLGGIKDLGAIAEKAGARALVITAALPDSARAAAREAASKLGLRLSEWNFSESELVPTKPAEAPVADLACQPAAGTDIDIPGRAPGAAALPVHSVSFIQPARPDSPASAMPALPDPPLPVPPPART